MVDREVKREVVKGDISDTRSKERVKREDEGIPPEGFEWNVRLGPAPCHLPPWPLHLWILPPCPTRTDAMHNPPCERVIRLPPCRESISDSAMLHPGCTPCCTPVASPSARSLATGSPPSLIATLAAAHCRTGESSPYGHTGCRSLCPARHTLSLAPGSVDVTLAPVSTLRLCLLTRPRWIDGV